MRTFLTLLLDPGRLAVVQAPEPEPEPTGTATLLGLSWTDFDTPYGFEHLWAMAGGSATSTETGVLSNTPEGARGMRYTALQSTSATWQKAQTPEGADTAYYTLRNETRITEAQALTAQLISRIGPNRSVEWGFINNENHTLNSLISASERNAIAADPYYASDLLPMLEMAFQICALSSELTGGESFDLSDMKGTNSLSGRAWDLTERYLNAKLYNDGVCAPLKAAYEGFKGFVIYRGGHRFGSPMPVTEYGYPQPYILGFDEADEPVPGAAAIFPRLEYIHSGVDSIYAWATNAVEVPLPDVRRCGIMGKTRDPSLTSGSKYARKSTTSADLVLTNDLAKIAAEIRCTAGTSVLVAPTVDYSQFQAGSTIVSYHRTPNLAPTYDPPHPGFVSRVRCAAMASRAEGADAYALALSAWDSSSYDANGDDIPDQPCSDAQRQVAEDILAATQTFLGPGAHYPVHERDWRYFGANDAKFYLPDGRNTHAFGQVCGDGRVRYLVHVERPSMPQVWTAEWEAERATRWPAVTVDVYRDNGSGGEAFVETITIAAGEAEAYYEGATYDANRPYRFEAQEGANACANAITDHDVMGAGWTRSGDVTQSSGGNTAPEDAANATLFRIDDSGSYAETTITGLTPGEIVCASVCMRGYSSTASGSVMLLSAGTELEAQSGYVREAWGWLRRYVTGVVPASGTLTFRATGYRIYICDARLQPGVYQPTSVE